MTLPELWNRKEKMRWQFNFYRCMLSSCVLYLLYSSSYTSCSTQKYLTNFTNIWEQTNKFFCFQINLFIRAHKIFGPYSLIIYRELRKSVQQKINTLMKICDVYSFILNSWERSIWIINHTSVFGNTILSKYERGRCQILHRLDNNNIEKISLIEMGIMAYSTPFHNCFV